MPINSGVSLSVAYSTVLTKGDLLLLGEYAVEDIRPIEWSDLPFAALTIPAPKKEVILAITRNRLGQPTPRGQIGHCTPTFDDVIQGKGRGIILLLQ